MAIAWVARAPRPRKRSGGRGARLQLRVLRPLPLQNLFIHRQRFVDAGLHRMLLGLRVRDIGRSPAEDEPSSVIRVRAMQKEQFKGAVSKA